VNLPPIPFTGVIDSGNNIGARIPYTVARKARLERYPKVMGEGYRLDLM
jgi:hypothetical protein